MLQPDSGSSPSRREVGDGPDKRVLPGGGRGRGEERGRRVGQLGWERMDGAASWTGLHGRKGRGSGRGKLAWAGPRRKKKRRGGREGSGLDEEGEPGQKRKRDREKEMH
jgi:hypothetical protein